MSPLAQEVIDALVEQQLLAGCRVCKAAGRAPVQNEENEQHVLVHLIVLPEGACAELDAVRVDDFANPQLRRVASCAIENRGDSVEELVKKLGQNGPHTAIFWRSLLGDFYKRLPTYEDTSQRAALFAYFFGLSKRRAMAAQVKDLLGVLTLESASDEELLSRLRALAVTLKAAR